MKKYFFLLILSLLFVSCFDAPDRNYDIHKHAYLLPLDTPYDSVEDVHELFKLGKFNIPTGDRVYHSFDKEKSLWLHIELPKNIASTKYFTIWHQYFNEANVYRVENSKIQKLYTVDRLENFAFKNVNFRLPTWKIEAGNDLNLLIKLDNSISLYTLKFLLQSENEFLEFVQKDSYVTSALITFFFVLLVFTTLLFLNERRYAYIWYGLVVFFSIIDLIGYKDLGLKYIWYNSPFFIVYFKTFIQVLGMTCLIIFQLKFYGKDRISKGFSIVLKTIVGVNIIIAFAFVFKYFFGGFENIKSITWLCITIQLLVLIVFHVTLAFKGKIPKYLAFAFTTPLILYQIRSLYNPSVDISIWYGLVMASMQYFATAFELLATTYFVVSEIIKEKKLASILKEENLKLQYAFQNKTLQVQQSERNKLLNNVHDSFGGYLEALKLRLLTKNQNTPERIQEILDAFYKEYRYLLNNLYSPTINAENFTDNLVEFCEKLNGIANQRIKHNLLLSDTKLSSETCMNLYYIISELTTNAIKYSKASEIKIEMFKDTDNLINIDVSDNGIGFENSIPSSSSFGLKSIEERVVMMNGTLNIDSKKGKGTQINIKIKD